MSYSDNLSKVAVPETLRALRHRNFRLFITGQIVSLIGSWMQGTAQRWLVYSMTANALILGVVEFASMAPVLLLSLFAGVVTDSVNRHKLIVLTQICAMLQAFALGFLTLFPRANGTPLISISGILILVTVAGIVNAFDLPARQSFVIQMVPKEDLNNAIALNSLTFNAARTVGPSIAAVMIGLFLKVHSSNPHFGEGMCFVVNGFSFMAVIYCLLRMKTAPQPMTSQGNSLHYLRDGLGYVRQHPHILGLVVYAGLMALFAIPYQMLMAVYTKDVLCGDGQSFGYLSAAIGVGAMVGGTLMARRKRVRGLADVILAGTLGFTIVIVSLVCIQRLWLASIVVAIAGFCMVVAMITSQTLVQLLVAESFRGRVMGLYTMIAVGFMPLGSLLSGAVARRYGIRTVLQCNGIMCLCIALGFAAALPSLRRSAHLTEEYQEAVAKEQGDKKILTGTPS